MTKATTTTGAELQQSVPRQKQHRQQQRGGGVVAPPPAPPLFVDRSSGVPSAEGAVRPDAPSYARARSATGTASSASASPLTSSSPRSVTNAAVTMTPQQQQVQPPPPPPPPPPPTEARNPFDQFGNVAATAAAAAASSAGGGSASGSSGSSTPRQHPLVVRSSSFDPAPANNRQAPPLDPLLAATATLSPPPQQGSKGVFGVTADGAAAPHPLSGGGGAGAGGAAAPHPLLAGSSPAGGGGVERKNPFDDLGALLSPTQTPPPPLSSSGLPPRPGHRGRPRGHRATQSLCLPSEFSTLVGGASSPVPTVPENDAMNPEGRAALKDLAASLSQAKPRALTEEEKAEEAKMYARVSLGEQPRESTGTKKSHRRKSSMDSLRKHVKGAVKDSISVVKDPRSIREIAHRHRKSTSLDAAAMSGIVNDINDAGGGTKVKEGKSPGGGGGVLGSLVMTPKSLAKRKIMGGLPDLSAPLTPGTPKTPKDKKDKKGGKKSSASSAAGTPSQSPISVVSGGGGSAPSTPGSACSGRGPNGGLGSAVDSPLDRTKLSPILSSRFGGLGEDLSDRNLGLQTMMPPPPPLDVPDLAPAAAAASPALAPTFASACSYAVSSDLPAMRSSEVDPAPFQVDIPPADDFLVHAKACLVMDTYRVIDQNFDFGALVGMSRMGLEAFVNPVSMDDEDDDDDEGGSSRSDRRGGTAADGAALIETAHRPIVSSVLGCADDAVVEGFFHEVGGAGVVDEADSEHGGGTAKRDRKKAAAAEDDTGTGRDKATDDRVECAVFYSHKRRQFVVVWRGTTADQAKPVRNRHVRAWKEARDRSKKGGGRGEEGGGGNCNGNLTSPDGKAATVFPPYLESYLSSGLESRVFRRLDELSERHPFCDVVMTGHSFGAALATLAAVRYASSRPMMRTSCQAFGCPRVGDDSFRHWANSLPNLRVARVEYGADPWVCCPEGTPWTHAGHALAVDAAAVSALAGERGAGEEANKSERGSVRALHGNNGERAAVPVRAYRFDKHRPGSADGGGGAAGWLDWAGAHHHHHHGGREKADRELRAYAGALEKISTLGLRWPREFVGEDVGRGVKGSGREKRLVV